MLKLTSLFLIFISSSLFADCSFEFNTMEQINKLENINSLQVDIPDSRKWNINLLKAAIDKTVNIQNKRKKKFDGYVTVFYNEGSCKYPAKIRISGDWKDHLTKTHASLDIALNKGNLGGMVKFKLFLPQTRHADSEIFVTELLKEFNIISPRTKNIEVKLNNNEYITYLFQEKSVKELLEDNNRREGPIFEGDEYLVWKNSAVYNEIFINKDLALSKLLNKKWAESSLASNYIASRATYELQKSYLLSKKNRLDNFIFFNIDNTNNESKKIWQTYYVLMIITGSFHGLDLMNAKFYWDSFNDFFEPIYYDGNAYIFKEFNFNKNLNTLENKNYYFNFLKDFNFNSILLELKKINDETFLNKLKMNNIIFHEKDVNKSFSKLISNLIYLKMEVKRHNFNQQNFETIENVFQWYIDEYNDRFNDDLIVKNTSYNNDQIINYFCFNSIKCSSHDTPSKSNHYILDIGLDTKNFNDLNLIESKLLNTKISLSKDMKFTENIIEKKITFYPYFKDSWALINNTNIGNITIEVKKPKLNIFSNKSKSRFNNKGLTGCLNFYNVKFNDLIFYSDSSGCEDAINIVRSSGNIKKLSIINSLSDSIDIDFSNVFISNVFVSNAGNDCIDVSGGNYIFDYLDLKNCSDKGVSIGEKSNVTIKNASISDSQIGIAVKDSSELNLIFLKSINNKECLSAYNKKQEFDGGKIFYKNIVCDKFTIKSDKQSLIKKI